MRKLLALLLLLPLLAQAGTINGNIQTASSGAVVNGTLTFTLNQVAVVSGTAQVVATGVQCYTSTAGAITGEPDPQAAPALSVNLASGTLAAGTYFVKFTYFDASGESLPSPEASITLASQGTLIVAAPAIQPANATGWRVYISSTTGTETRQVSQTGFASSYQQTAALANGAALPGTNTSVCSIRFTDEMIPTTTYYTVNLVNQAGSKIAGYPISQARFYGGSNGSVNVSNGWPVSIGGVIWPTPIVSTPNANATQSIAGGLNLNGFPFFAGSICYKFENLKATLVVSVSCGYTTWAAALADCPSAGCILDGTAPDVPLALGTFDTGSNTKPVTVDLGPYSFTTTQVTARQGLKMRGAGTLSTNLTSVGTNAQPVFVNPQVNNNAITIEISDMSINALAGNTSQDGMFFDCSTLTNAGVELSRFDNLIFNGFNGSSIHFKATQDGTSGSIGCTQGNTFTNVMANRPTGATGATQNALRIEGGAGQFEFWNCWFTGISSDTGTNVFIGTTGTSAPYSIHFHGCTNQNGFSYKFDGGTSITTENDHCEVIKGMYNLANTSQLLVGINIKTPHINTNCGVNAGNGYIINIPNTVTNADVLLDTPLVYSTPDKLVNNQAGNSASPKVINVRTFNSSTPVNVYSSVGITGTLNPAATVDLKSWNTVQVNASGTSMSTFKSTLMPGESVTLYATGGTIQFATGGNLSLGTQTSPMVVPSGDSATFMRVDAGTPAFVLIGLSTKTLTSPVINGTPTGTGIPTITFKKGTGAGNYSSASTSDVAVDGTNLAATVTIPSGWKLSIVCSGGITSLTATVTVFVGIADGGTTVLTEPVFANGIGTFVPFALAWEINGDGASHTIDLRYHTSNGADSVSINNASSTQLPTMIFTLTPSN